MKKLLALAALSLTCTAFAGYKSAVANGYTWIYEESGDEALICGLAERPSGTLTFPSELGGLAVRRLPQSYWQFENPWEWYANEWYEEGGYWDYVWSEEADWVGGITKLVIPEGVTKADGFNARSWRNLSDVSLPDSLESCDLENAFYGTPFYKSKTFPGFVLSASGKKLFGVKQYDAIWDFSKCPDAVIPATVTEIADYALGYFSAKGEYNGEIYEANFSEGNVRIVFAGAKPKASDRAFAREWWNDEGQKTYRVDWKGVYYHEGTAGWIWGEEWCGVRTYSLGASFDEYTVASSLKFGRIYAGEMPDAGWSGFTSYEIWDSHDIGLYGDEYAFIPVTGTGALKPVLYGDVPAGWLDSPQVWTDQKMFDTFTPKGASPSKWDDDGDEWYYETNKKEWSWPKEIWPDNAPVANRRWIVVHAKEKAVWSGVWSFRVGLAGTSEISDPVIVVPSEEFDQNGALATFSANDFFRGITISGYESLEAWDEVVSSPAHSYLDPERPRMQTYELENWKAFEKGKPMTFTVVVPSAGTLVVSSEDDDEDSPAMKDVFSVTGNGIVSDTASVTSTDDWESPNYRWNVTNFWKTSCASHIRRIEVSGATTLTFTGIDEDCEFNRMYFFPKNARSVAVEVGYAGQEDMDGEYDYWSRNYIQGCVTGSGVYRSGETATLKAIAGDGEQFDHWEVRFGNLTLTDAQKKNPTLSFKVTDAMCGEMADEEQIFISAVWKPKYKVTVLPSIVGAGDVTGSGRYYAGTTVTLTATAKRGYDFVKWSDGVTSATRQLKVVEADADVERIIYACFAPNGEAPAVGVYGWTATKAVTLNGALYDADGDVAGVVQLKVAKPNAKKKTAKVSGYVMLLDGKKYSVKAAQAKVEDGSPLEISTTVKTLGALTATIGDDGFSGEVGGYTFASADVGGALANGTHEVSVECDDFETNGEMLDDLLPEGEEFKASGTKWTFAKAAMVKWAKDKETKEYTLVVNTDKGKTNLSGLKLTYNAKTALFKGAFKVFCIEEGANGKFKLKKYTFKMTGVVVGGEGFGQATCKKPSATWRVSVE